jgi:polyvinyl alcohol dehydrogenase (cytochrome)
MKIGKWARMTRSWLALALLGLAAAGGMTAAQAAPAPTVIEGRAQPGWHFAGQNLSDTHYAAAEHTIGPGNVGRLAPRWTFTAGGNVSATPTVVGGVVYFPDWGGNLWAVSAASGQAIWSRRVSDYTGVDGDISRLSPAYWRGLLVTGDGALISPVTNGAYMFAVDARTGALRWKTKVDSDPAAIMTSSAVVSNGIVYAGVSSNAERQSAEPTFRGSAIALDARTGKMLWKTHMVPEGYTGGPIWSSTAAVDHKRGLLYVTTGNNYSTPDGICGMPDETGCTPPPASNHIDSIVALDLRSGAIVWSRPTLTADTWTVAKRFGPDFDFGAGPNLFTTTINGKPTEVLGAGQKSGVYWALNPDDGAILWATPIGPGGPLGGIQWGTATDGKRIYASIGNWGRLPYTLQGSGPHAGKTITGGSWTALDAATGKILWQTPDPQGDFVDDSMISAANGVVYVGSWAPSGTNMYALDARTGAVKWAFASGGAVAGGPAIVDGSLYWGSGYHTEAFRPPLGYEGDNNKLYAFSLPR